MVTELLIYAFSFGVTGLLVYVLMRYGKASHSWVKLEKEQIRELKEENKRYRSMRAPVKPERPALYKRKMTSHEGIAIYKNGIYAKFCVGRDGRYRFVPFQEISRINPVRIDNPFSTRDSLLTGPASIKGLQIETESSMVLLVTSRSHDFERLVPILRQAMGAWWGSKFQENETIWGNYIEGDLLIPRKFRRAAPSPPSADRPFVLPQAPAPIKDKGRLLLEESVADIKERARAYLRGGALLAAIGIALTMTGVYLLFMIVLPYTFCFFQYMLLLVGLMLVLLGGVLFYVSRRLKPAKVYENGIEGTAPVGTRTVFYSFGELTSVSETRNFIDGEIYVFKTNNPTEAIAIRKNMRGFSNLMDMIRSKMGREEFIARIEETPEQTASSRKIEYAFYVMSVVIGIVGSVAACYALFRSEDPMMFVIGLGLVMPPFVMIAITYATFSMKRRISRMIPKRLNVKIPAAVVVTMLVYFFVNMVAFSGPGQTSPGERYIGPKPASSYIAPGVYLNETLYVAGNILVDSGQTTEFSNTSIVFSMTADKQYGIWVAEGGRLVLDESSVTSSNPNFAYTFEIMGSALIKDTTITGLWGKWHDYDGGIEIYSDDVVIESSHITDARMSTIIVVDSSPLIANTTISGAGDDGIELQNSNASVLNNSISGCWWAMYIYGGGRPNVQGNRISRNDYGILIDAANPVVRNNTFEHTAHEAVRYKNGAKPILTGNLYISNGRNIISEDSLDYNNLCMAFTVGTTVVCLLVLFYVYKQGSKEEDTYGRYGRLLQNKEQWKPPQTPR